jgi:hypothetical protein
MQLAKELSMVGPWEFEQVKARMHVTHVYHVNKKSCANKRNVATPFQYPRILKSILRLRP